MQPNSSSARLTMARPWAGMLDVAEHQHRFLPGLRNPISRLSRTLVLVEIGDQDVRALAGEGDGDGPADTAVAAGDYGALAPGLPRADIARLAMVRPRYHRGGLARHRLALFREWGSKPAVIAISCWRRRAGLRA